jgi:hypothetical protein
MVVAAGVAGVELVDHGVLPGKSSSTRSMLRAMFR